MSDRMNDWMSNQVRDWTGALNRRAFLRQSLAAALLAPAAGALASLAGCGGEEKAAAPVAPSPAPAPPAPAAAPAGAFVTDIAANAPLVSSLQYKSETPVAGQRCDGCQLYTAVAAGNGRCSIFPQGLVAAGGHCTSWVKRQP